MTMNDPAISRSWNRTDSRWDRYWSVIVRSDRRERSISLVRQRWSSRSSGPTNDSTLTVRPADSGTAPWVVVSGALIYSMRGPRNGPRTPPVARTLPWWGRGQFVRALPWPGRGCISTLTLRSRGRGRTFSVACSWLELDGVADLGHGGDRDPARALGALVEDLHDLGGLLHVVLAALPDPGQRGQHVLEQHPLAVEAPDRGGAAAGRALLAGPLRGEDAVEVEHRADVGVAGIGAPLARRIRHHRLDPRGDLRRRVRQVDRPAVRHRH